MKEDIEKMYERISSAVESDDWDNIIRLLQEKGKYLEDVELTENEYRYMLEQDKKIKKIIEMKQEAVGTMLKQEAVAKKMVQKYESE